MYQVIARTWRPQRFAEVIGQRHVAQTLQNAIRLNRIGHGYIFSGQRGVGKTTVARLLAKALNCRNGPAPEPCGECDSCREVAAGRSVDVLEIDAASNRGIDAVRELRENVRYAPARDRYKVFIIDEAHQITPEGFNALLKTLEEPPPHVVFVLATTEAHQLPETILSRCQHFAFHAVRFADIRGHLERVCAAEGVEADPEALDALAASGEGSLRDSLSRLEQALAAFGSRLDGPAVRRMLGAAPSRMVEEVFAAVRDQERERMLQLVSQLIEEGYQLTHFATQLVRAARNLLVLRVAASQPQLLEASEEERRRWAALAEQFSEESLMRFLEILLQLHQELRFSMEPRFQMELGLLKLVDAERLLALEDLLARVESLAASGAPGPSAESRSGAGPSGSAPSSGGGAGSERRPSPFEQDLARKKQSGTLLRSEPEAEAAPSSEGEAAGEVASPTISAAEGAVAGGSEDSVPSVASVASVASAVPSREEIWVQEVLRLLREREKPILASLLPEVPQWEFGEAEVRVRLTDQGLAQMLPDSDRRFLERVISEVTDRRVKLALVGDWKDLSSPGVGSRTRPDARSTGAPLKDSAAEARPGDSLLVRVSGDPEVLEFERLFGKRVTGVRRWGE